MTIVRVVTPTATVDLTGVGFEPIGHVAHDGKLVTDEGVLREVELVLGAGSLANDATLQQNGPGRWSVHGDPTEAAFLVAEEKVAAATTLRRRFERVAEVPFTSERRRMSTVHRDTRRGRRGIGPRRHR